MDIYLLALNFIVADKLMGGMPSKLIEHIVINNVLALTLWSASKLLYGAGYLAMLPFTFTKANNSNNEPYTVCTGLVTQCNATGVTQIRPVPFCEQKGMGLELSVSGTLIDTAFYNEYVIEQRDISPVDVPWGADLSYTPTLLRESINRTPSGCTSNWDSAVIGQNTEQMHEQTTEQLPHQCVLPVQLSSDWEIINKDDSKIILTNNKKGKEIIITKKEVDDMILITNE
jgi:hypothetical protein